MVRRNSGTSTAYFLSRGFLATKSIIGVNSLDLPPATRPTAASSRAAVTLTEPSGAMPTFSMAETMRLVNFLPK